MKDGFKWTGAKSAKGYQVSNSNPLSHFDRAMDRRCSDPLHGMLKELPTQS